jgi:hypothetical protein
MQAIHVGYLRPRPLRSLMARERLLVRDGRKQPGRSASNAHPVWLTGFAENSEKGQNNVLIDKLALFVVRGCRVTGYPGGCACVGRWVL